MAQPPFRTITVQEFPLSPQATARLVGIAILVFVIVILASQGTYVVQPGDRGVRVTLGNVSPEFVPEGLAFKLPFATRIIPVMVRQRTESTPAECYSSDLQQVNAQLELLYRVREAGVVEIFKNYAGDPFTSLIVPRVQEALKEVAATQTAEMIVTNRLEVKLRALDLARAKVGTNLLDVVDLVIRDLSLSKELETAIEQKMIREQEAAKARFAQRQAEIDAETEIIRAKGVAEALGIRGEALRQNPAFIDLQIAEKWDGIVPLAIGLGEDAGNLLLPLPTSAPPATR